MPSDPPPRRQEVGALIEAGRLRSLACALAGDTDRSTWFDARDVVPG